MRRLLFTVLLVAGCGSADLSVCPVRDGRGANPSCAGGPNDIFRDPDDAKKALELAAMVLPGGGPIVGAARVLSAAEKLAEATEEAAVRIRSTGKMQRAGCAGSFRELARRDGKVQARMRCDGDSNHGAHEWWQDWAGEELPNLPNQPDPPPNPTGTRPDGVNPFFLGARGH